VLKRLRSRLKKEIFISSITVAELEYGVSKSGFTEKNKLALIGFLSAFSILDFNDRDAVEYGEIRTELERKGMIIGPLDLLIAAQARAGKLVLVTNNVKEFERVEGLGLENWAGE
jgi:tRNA(fMet)-specific endonuclease VapC